MMFALLKASLPAFGLAVDKISDFFRMAGWPRTTVISPLQLVFQVSSEGSEVGNTRLPGGNHLTPGIFE
jgi:hypothetical protein